MNGFYNSRQKYGMIDLQKLTNVTFEDVTKHKR